MGQGLYFDLTVPGPENYLAEGLWNHNSGKTSGIVIKALDLAARNWPVGGMVVEPTFPMVRKILIPAFRQFLNKRNIPWRYNKNEHVLTVRLAGKWCEIQLDSAHDPERLKGPNIAYAIVDEAGICDPGVWEHLPARVRHEDAKVAQFIAVGTPEGFGDFYEWAEGKWGESVDVSPDGITVSEERGVRHVLRAETYDNIFLKDGPEAYIRKRLSHLDESDLEQYVRGRFVAKGSRVYRGFTDENGRVMRMGNSRIHVGADFNVGRMCWEYGERVGSEGIHIHGEVIRYDTTTERQGEALTMVLMERLTRETGRQWGTAEVRRMTTIHCDPSAKNRSTRAERSDVEQLREMGFEVQCNRTTIPIKDRVSTVNWRAREKHLTVDILQCPELVRSLKQQGRDKNGEPEKKAHDPDNPDADLSGPADALGYLVWAFPEFRRSVPQGNNEVRVSGYLG
jgi:hypothetical protein